MTILTIIPARSGSKRVPGKNTKLLDGIPLIAHTIKAAQAAACHQTIFVSTDCEHIAHIARQYGAVVPALRSAALATDDASVMDAMLEAVERFKQTDQLFDSILLLQPTSPFRTAQSIQTAIRMHQKNNHPVVSVSPPTIKPNWFKVMNPQGFLNPFETPAYPENKLYQLNGSIYLATVEQILTQQSFYTDSTEALILDNAYETLDIDTPLDWALAEKIVELRKQQVAACV